MPVRDTADQRTFGTEWWRGAAIYQIYPRSFQDTNGDGIGDLPGITAHLPYVADLGVDAIWISPFFTSPMRDFGYDVSNYRDVDPTFGTLADFDQLVAEAHRLGLKVLIDQVLSHSSDQHAWFKESRTSRTNYKADWYVWAEAKPDGTPPNNWQSVFGGSAWTWEPRRRQYYLHNFLESQPDLNFHHEPVQTQLLEEVRFWMERGVDGFRFDACNFHFHDPQLRNNPAARPGSVELTSVKEGNPYGWQIHRYDKTRPENLGFLKRLRTLMDQVRGHERRRDRGRGRPRHHGRIHRGRRQTPHGLWLQPLHGRVQRRAHPVRGGGIRAPGPPGRRLGLLVALQPRQRAGGHPVGQGGG